MTNRVTFQEIVDAHHAAAGTLLKIDLHDRRFVVRDMKREGHIIKRFRPHHTAIEVKRWIDETFPAGVYMAAERSFGQLLRYRHHVIVPDTIKRALAKVEGSEG